MMKRAKFSRDVVHAAIQRRLTELLEHYPFDATKGVDQCAGKSMVVHRAYGEFRALHGLADELGLADDGTEGDVYEPPPVEARP